MIPSLLMENEPRRIAVQRVAHTAQRHAKSLKDNAFSAFSMWRRPIRRGDGSLSALSYAVMSHRTQLVVVEGVRTGCRTQFNAFSDSQITNFNILVGREIGIVCLGAPNFGERHG